MTIAEPHAAAAPKQPAAHSRAPVGLAAFGLTTAALFAFAPTISGLAKSWAASSSFHHGFVVAPIAVWLCLRLGPPPSPARIWPPALAAIAAGLALWLVGRAGNVNLVEQIAFIGILISITALALGPAYIRRWWFPLVFLFFMAPFGDGLLPRLQEIAADGVVALLKISGVRAAIDGVMIATGAGRFEIAESCAGLNFLLAAIMLAALFAHLAFSGARKIILFTLFAAVFAIIANILRAYFVILTTTLSEGKIAIASDHLLFGWAFYGFLLLILFMIGRAFADPIDQLPRRRAFAAASVGIDQRGRQTPTMLVVAAALILLGAVYGRLVVERSPQMSAPAFLPLISASGWRPLPPTLDWRAHLDHADRIVRALYQSGDKVIQVNAGYFTHGRQGAEIAGHDTRSYDGEIWRRISTRRQQLPAFGAIGRFKIETLKNARGAQLEAVTLYWLENQIFASPAALKIRQASARILGRQPHGGAIIIVAPSSSGDAGMKAIEAFLTDAEPLSAWLARIESQIKN